MNESGSNLSIITSNVFNRTFAFVLSKTDGMEKRPRIWMRPQFARKSSNWVRAEVGTDNRFE
jgi:hypothetical protein